MNNAELITLIARLGFGALATFFAIVLWSNTRDTAWLFVIMGTILRYGEIMYSTFQLFGILSGETIVFGVPIVRIILTNLPALLYAIAFLIMIT
ncbi:MAG: hypothetical protein HN368_18035, partial [Spirochaetales bacterium]|nr:hypothetical protein [Spirochaetales bacterium]